MREPIVTRGKDPSDHTPLNTEVWQCPRCDARADLVPQADGVLLRCGGCGFVRHGQPAPNFDVE